MVRAALDKNTADIAREYSSKIISAVGVRHISRIDFFLSDGILYFNEINTMPGFTRTSLYPALIEDSGISVSKMISSLIEDAASDRRI